MPPVRFETVMPASERLQTNAIEIGTGIGLQDVVKPTPVAARSKA
jgi:hypothetical protein